MKTENKIIKNPIAEMQCKRCGNKEFSIRFCNDGAKKSLLLDCKCGRVVEMRGDFQAIELTPNFTDENSMDLLQTEVPQENN